MEHTEHPATEVAQPGHKSPKKPSRRAARACLYCRRRKVRCDVARREGTCTNCLLDEKRCEVVAKRHRGTILGNGIKVVPIEKPSSSEYNLQEDNQSAGEPHANGSIVNPVSDPPIEESAMDATCMNNLDSEIQLLPLVEAPGSPSPGLAQSSTEEAAEDQMDLKSLPELNMENFIYDPLSEMHDSTVLHFSSSVQVPFSYYPFVGLACLGALPSSDVAFLESQGSLHLPSRILLDELMHHYFLHIHPVLPLIHEGDFWEVYQQRVGSTAPGAIPLPVLHAMLFASCTFVCETTVRRLGYSDIRSMRASFFRRAKLLLDFGADPSPLSSAQAALLLSFSSMSTRKKVDTSWLTSAIENARLVDAHQYFKAPKSTNPAQKCLLKRVWWCCIIRDRSLSLLMRRPICITRDDFDFTTHGLQLCDFEDEFERSKVYDNSTKETLARILIQKVDLFVALTDALALIFPYYSAQGMSPARSVEVSKCVSKSKQRLSAWHTDTRLKLPEKALSTMATLGSSVERKTSQESILLYTNLMFMYYHTAQMILCNYEVFHLCVFQRYPGASRSPIAVIYENLHDLQDAICNLSSCHGALVERDLIQRLPNSAVGCAVLPLVLKTVNDNCRVPTFQPRPGSDKGTSQKEPQPDILTTVMKVYQTRYDSVDWIYDIIGYMIDLVMPKPENPAASCDWIDILAFQPDLYLRLVLGVDICLSKGRFPREDELSQCLDATSQLETDGAFLDRFDGGETESLDSASEVEEQDDSVSSMADSTPQPLCDSHDNGQPTLEDFARQDCLGLFGNLIDTL